MKKNIYGYCRISTSSQSIDRQIRNVKELYPSAIIVEEVFTGTKIYNRPKWNDLIKKVSIPGYPDRFDGTLEDHFHFLCLECGDIQDLFIQPLYGIGSIVEEAANVQVTKCEMTFKGICSNCQAKQIN